jgi:hypothetical protein
VGDGLDHVLPLEQPPLLLRPEPVLDVVVTHDLGQASAAPVLADQVLRAAVLGRGPGEQEGEGIPEEGPPPEHEADCIVGPVQASSQRGRFAERVLHGIDDAGNAETIVVWIERKEGGVWAVGRAVNPQHRSTKAPRPEDYLFEGYELGDALEQANAALEDDLTVSERDGRSEHLRPFTRDELLKPLEAWFFGRS